MLGRKTLMALLSLNALTLIFLTISKSSVYCLHKSENLSLLSAYFIIKFQFSIGIKFLIF